MDAHLLVVTADDYGASPAIDRGICDAIEAGTVTAVSVLANGAALESFYGKTDESHRARVAGADVLPRKDSSSQRDISVRLKEAEAGPIVGADVSVRPGEARPGPAARARVDRRYPFPDGVSIGAHLNFTEGEPISRPATIPSLLRRVDPSAEGRGGCEFYPLSALLVRASLGLVRPGDVTREALAQIERLRAVGLTLSHADSHQHVHVHPALAVPIAEAVRGMGIYRMRNPSDWSSGPSVLKARATAFAAGLSARYFAGVATTSAARGIARRPTSLEELEAILASLPAGPTEMIVHLRAPGPFHPGEARMPDLSAREAEWRTLTDPRAVELVRERGVRLVGAGYT